jgi:hypothetical protein
VAAARGHRHLPEPFYIPLGRIADGEVQLNPASHYGAYRQIAQFLLTIIAEKKNSSVAVFEKCRAFGRFALVAV